MGDLVYDSDTLVEFDDRVLAHLEVVVISKLRRRESFSVSWRESEESGGGRNTLWLDVALPLRFRFDETQPPAISRTWVERLANSASGPTGLIVTDEAGQLITGKTTHLHRPAQRKQ